MTAIINPTLDSPQTIRSPGPEAQNSNSFGGELGNTSLYTVDDLLFYRGQITPGLPLVAYPATARGTSDYIHYTASDLNRFANEGAKKFSSIGLTPGVGTHL